MKKIASPCIDHCELNVHGVCEGCLRSVDEITIWSKMTEEEKQLVLDRINELKDE